MLKCTCDAHKIITDSCYLVCTGCGDAIYDPWITVQPKYAPRSYYSRVNYLKETLKEICGEIHLNLKPNYKERVLLDLEVYYNLMELVPDYETVKTVLKKYQLRKYYSAIPHLLYSWFNIQPLFLSNDDRKTIIKVFKRVETDFNKERKSIGRSNFFSYNLFIMLMLSKMGIYCNCIPLKPKNRYERNKQTKILIELINKHFT